MAVVAGDANKREHVHVRSTPQSPDGWLAVESPL